MKKIKIEYRLVPETEGRKTIEWKNADGAWQTYAPCILPSQVEKEVEIMLTAAYYVFLAEGNDDIDFELVCMEGDDCV